MVWSTAASSRISSLLGVDDVEMEDTSVAEDEKFASPGDIMFCFLLR